MVLHLLPHRLQIRVPRGTAQWCSRLREAKKGGGRHVVAVCDRTYHCTVGGEVCVDDSCDLSRVLLPPQVLLERDGEGSDVRHANVLHDSIQVAQRDACESPSLRYHLRPQSPPLPEPAVGLVRPEHEQDREEAPHKLVRPPGDGKSHEESQILWRLCLGPPKDDCDVHGPRDRQPHAVVDPFENAGVEGGEELEDPVWPRPICELSDRDAIICL
mmetsp:Transcript_57651/g.139207  ORF Transcript_57651/g.139207 Transcript_57651/m.139207 type:complete len:215 (+) Transcript_57651:694-1338(+)